MSIFCYFCGGDGVINALVHLSTRRCEARILCCQTCDGTGTVSQTQQEAWAEGRRRRSMRPGGREAGMSDFICARPVTSLRKPRRCAWCEETIRADSPGICVVGVFDGHFAVFYAHPECEDAWKRDPCNEDGTGCIYEHARGQTCADAVSEPPVRQC